MRMIGALILLISFGSHVASQPILSDRLDYRQTQLPRGMNRSTGADLPSAARVLLPAVRKSIQEVENRRESEVKNTVGFKELIAKDPGAAVAAWTGANSVRCAEAQKKLSGLGLSGSEFVLNLNKQVEAEREFGNSCLSPATGIVHEKIAPHVGVLRSDGDAVLCTVTLLSSRYVITARHCLFDQQLLGSLGAGKHKTGLDLLDSANPRWYVEFGPLGSGSRSNIEALWLPFRSKSDNAWTRKTWKEAAESIFDLSDTESQRRDYLVLELAAPIKTTGKSVSLAGRSMRSERVHLFSYYVGHRLQNISADSGIRVQTSGMCQILFTGPGQCLQHACATTQAASGAPIFVEHDVGGTTQLVLAGLHTSGTVEKTFCEKNRTFGNTLNYGIQIPYDEVSQFQQEKS